MTYCKHLLGICVPEGGYEEGIQFYTGIKIFVKTVVPH
jgi:hypothetical protein